MSFLVFTVLPVLVLTDTDDTAVSICTLCLTKDLKPLGVLNPWFYQLLSFMHNKLLLYLPTTSLFVSVISHSLGVDYTLNYPQHYWLSVHLFCFRPTVSITLLPENVTGFQSMVVA